MSRIRFAAVLFLAALGCGKGAILPHTPTFTEDVEPLLQQNCNGCHVQGGIAPFALDHYVKVRVHAAAILDNISKGVGGVPAHMPPWPPSEKGAPLKYSRSMSDADIATIRAWVESGMPLGPESAHQNLPPKLEQKIRSDMGIAMKVPYTPSLGLSDDYRCFVIDPHASEGSLITGYNIQPGERGQVHHVILYEVFNEGDMIAQLNALDGADGRPGYQCFGGPGVAIDGGGPSSLPPIRFVGAWAPGEGAVVLPAHTGIPLKPGARLLMQVHYNTLNGHKPDQTQIALQLDPPLGLVEALMVPITNDRFLVPAGESNLTSTVDYLMPDYLPAATVYSTYPHMHLHGTKISFSVVKKGVETTLIDIPNWHFHWQGSYELEKPYVVDPGDTLRLSCTFDNSVANQPWVNGVQLTPHDLSWGERTSDEMCLSFLYLTLKL